MDSLGPLSLMYSWQALLCATACVGITQLVKTVIDIVYAKKVKDKAGDKLNAKELRKDNVWLTRLVLPLIPILVGALYAMAVPLRPEVLVEYAQAHIEGRLPEVLAFAAWGAACGQFATMTHEKLKRFLKAASPA